MDQRRGTILLVLSCIWIAVVTGYMSWGLIYYAGLYKWLADLQLARGDSYSVELTAIIPGFLLAGPALWYIRRHSQLALAREGTGPAAEARRLRRGASVAAVFGLLCVLIAGGAWYLSQRVPDGSEEPLPLDLAALGSGTVPTAKVAVRGTIDPEVSTGMEESGGYVDRTMVYYGFRPDGTGKDAPLQLFIERSFQGRAEAGTAQAFMPEQTGYLIANGIPPPALRDLEARGIRVASPHYVLRTRSGIRREPYFIVGTLAAVGAFACLLAALVGAIKARSRARRAEAG